MGLKPFVSVTHVDVYLLICRELLYIKYDVRILISSAFEVVGRSCSRRRTTCSHPDM